MSEDNVLEYDRWKGLTGVYNVMTTPFDSGGRVDERSLRRLLAFVIDLRVDGVTVLGVAGEAHKLDVAERDLIVSTAIDVARGRIPVFVGTSSDRLDATIAASVAAERAGAAGVMATPPRGTAMGGPLAGYFAELAGAIAVPIILQDFPESSGVSMSPADMVELLAAVPQISTIKLESAPTPWNVQQTSRMLPPGRTILGGMGGVYFLSELRRGASGTMTGFAYPEVLLEIWRRWCGGDRDGAAATYAQYLPLLVFEGQPKVGLAIRKAALRLRGLIENARIRPPGMQMNAELLDDLTDVLRTTRVRERFDSASARRWTAAEEGARL